MNPESLSEEQIIMRAIRRIIQKVEHSSMALKEQYAITGPQLSVLTAVAGTAGVPVTVLSKQLYLSPSTLVGIIDRLERKGLLLRQRDQRDRRIQRVRITTEGEALVASTPIPLQDRLEQGLSRLLPAERAGITRSLETLVDLLEARSLDAAPLLAVGPLTQS